MREETKQTFAKELVVTSVGTTRIQGIIRVVVVLVVVTLFDILIC